jgi:hypothetical protein
MFTLFFVAVLVWFFTALFTSMVECIRCRKQAIDSIKRIATSGTLKQMKSLCKGNPRFAGYSRLNKAELSEFILARI